MRPNLPFLSAASNALLKSGGLLRWKGRLVKDARLSLPLTEVMKIAKLSSPLLDAARQSSPRPKLRHGRRLALLFHPNSTQKLYTRESASVYAAYLRSHFSVSQPKAMHSGARSYLSKLHRAMCPVESHSSFCSPFSPAEFLVTAKTFPHPLPLAQTKLPIPC